MACLSPLRGNCGKDLFAPASIAPAIGGRGTVALQPSNKIGDWAGPPAILTVGSVGELLPYFSGGAVKGVNGQYRQSASHRNLTRYEG